MKTNVQICLISFILAFFLGACAHPEYNAQGITPAHSGGTTPFVNDEQALVFVTLSGGGTRAATMSWKALEKFKQIPYVFKDHSGKTITSNLAQQIDYISGISGGSFAAAAWCFYHDDMQYFRKNFIERDIQKALFHKLFWPPTNGIKLLSPYFNRIHIASEYYDTDIFHGKTFKDLPASPVLWINATNLARGERFTYDKKYWDYLNSDLSKYPIGYACAASSAFPILLSPMTVINYPPPVDLQQDTKYFVAKLNAPTDSNAYYYCLSREFYNKKTNKFIHLADGGLVDNQGLQVVIDQFDTGGIINKALNNTKKPLKRLIIINVNAGVSAKDNSCKKESAPGIASVMEYTMVTSMDILSGKRWMEIKAKCDELNKAIIDDQKNTQSLALLEKPYTIEISFRQLNDDERKECNKLPTSFKLSKKQIALIDDAVTRLVEQNAELKRLAEDVATVP